MDSLYPDLIKLLIEKYFDANDSLTLLDTLEIFASYKDAYKDVLSDSIEGWNYCVKNGKLDAFIFIYQKNEHCTDFDNAFKISCANGHLNVARWLVNLGNEISSPVNIHASDECAFRCSCENGYLNIAQWLIELSNKINSPTDIHGRNEYPFRWSCARGHLNVAQWLVNLGDEINSPINIHIENEYAFRLSCCYGHSHIVQWLIEYSNKINSLIDNSILLEYSKKLII